MNKRWFLGPLFEEAGEQSGGGGDALPDLPAQTPPPNTEMADLRSKVDQLAAAMKQQPVQQPQQQQAPTNDPAAMKKAAEKEFWADPLGTLQKVAAGVAEHVRNETAEPLAAVAKDQIRKTDPELFDALSLQIEQNMQGMAPQYKANPTMWANAFAMAKGQNMDKVLALKNKNTPAAANEGPIVPGSRPAPAAGQPKLNQEESAFARKMKLSPEAYTQGKEFADNQDKFWKKVITFDSIDSRREAPSAK